MFALTLALVAWSAGGGVHPTGPDAGSRTIRMLDLDGDGLLDRVQVERDGTLQLSLNRGHRQFEPIVQSLPAVVVADVLAKDLDGDGRIDLYFVSPGDNVALVGDGTGRFVEATQQLGLADAGVGTNAELVDIDQDGRGDVLLHDTDGDVIFWGTETGAFERDPATPVRTAAPAEPVASSPIAGSTPPAAGAASTPAGASSAYQDGAGITAAPGASHPLLAAPRVRAPGREPIGPIPPGSIDPAVAIPFCALQIRDVTTGNCLEADSTPTLGRIYPLGPEFDITPAGDVGVGTTSPGSRLEVAGDARVDGVLRVANSSDVVHRGSRPLFGQAASYTVDSGSNGVMIESGESESGGFFANGNVATIWSPGDGIQGGFDSVVLSVFDEDVLDLPNPQPEFVVDDIFGVRQPVFRAGLVKAAVQVDGTGTASITRAFNLMPGGISPALTDLGTGLYEINFGVDITARWYVATLGVGGLGNAANGTIDVAPRAGNANALFVNTSDTSGMSTDNEFFVLIY